MHRVSGRADWEPLRLADLRYLTPISTGITSRAGAPNQRVFRSNSRIILIINNSSSIGLFVWKYYLSHLPVAYVPLSA